MSYRPLNGQYLAAKSELKHYGPQIPGLKKYAFANSSLFIATESISYFFA